MAKVTTSALEAKEWGFLDRNDYIVMNRDHLLHQARQAVLGMHDMGYLPPPPEKVYAVGRRGFEALHGSILGMRNGGFITDHDVTVATHLARVLCGGNDYSPKWVDEQHFLDLEREAFVSLCGEPKTQERIEHMLKTNKPLRN
jgi:3-hydroxyacyl-CoA dehydrogenase